VLAFDPVTPNLGLTLPAVGDDLGKWGGLLNRDLSLIDAAYGASPAAVGSSFHLVSAAGNNYHQIKSAPGTFLGCSAFSGTDNYPLFIKLFNQTNEPNPAGGDVPLVVIGVQAGEPRDVEPSSGVSFTTGIALLVVKGIGDADDTPVLAGDVALDIFWT
jgi:hypothetical protein